MKKLLFTGLLVVLTLLLSSCQSLEFYQERAVNRARAYLLNQCRTLTPEQREYVKFNKPLIMSESILGDHSPHQSKVPDTHMTHFCITWAIPEQEKLYMVFGVSDSTLRMWFPERLIIKNFITPLALDKAIISGRDSALQTLLLLPRRDVNRIRFSNPEVKPSNYELTMTPEGKKITPTELAALQKLSQYSLFWDSCDGVNKIVVIGLGNPHEELWKPFSSINLPPKMLEKMLIVAQDQPAESVEPAEPEKDAPEDKTKKTEVEKMLESLDDNDGESAQ